MLFDLIIIVLVIVISYVYVYITKKFDYNKQLLFIILTLFIVSLYKVQQYYNLNKITTTMEEYTDFSEQINKFLSQSDKLPNSSTPDFDYDQYKDSINKLKDEVSKLTNILEQQNIERKNNELAMEDTEESIKCSRKIQDDRMKRLQNDINRTKDLITKAELETEAKKYKKIPVYSSCIVSNADGSDSIDNPQILTNNTSGTQGVLTIGQQRANGLSSLVSPSTTTISNSQASQQQSESSIASMINHIFANGIDLNVSM
jgi:hypothetical protein